MIRTHMLPCHLPKHEADALNRESGRIYTKTLVTHYRVYRKKGTKRRHWLSRGAAERLGDYLLRDDPPLLHAHSKDAAQQGFYKAITTARANRQLGAKYPYKRKRWRTTIWKETGIRVEATETGTLLLLARARGLAPIRVRLPTAITTLPCWRVREVRLVWDRAARHYTWHVVVEDGQRPAPPAGTAVVAVDLGEVHPAACTDGTETVIIAARRVRATQQYTAKRLAALRRQQARQTKGSRRHRRLQRRKNRFLAQQRRRVRDLEHKVSRAVVAFAVERRAGTIALGDVRTVADGKRLNRNSQQKVSSWSHGRQRQYITYKAEAAGIRVVLVDEAYSSQTCPNPACTARHKPQGRVYRCPACGLRAHRDAVGAANLLSRFLYGAVGQIRPPPATKYRRPAVIIHGKRSMRSRLDTAHVARG
ncbi:MAG: transposase [Herpetosiphonaceae bacterium]|nr:MAG: transposase [Herpetosiphonaceae bacterium]